jgi:sugar O-acyltransferase (sialic acid O-acetyltransferase NeuD family)
MTHRIVIVGAGGFGREVLSHLRSSPVWREANAVSDIVFIDDGQPEIPTDMPIVATVQDFVPGPQDRLLCAIGNPSVRKSVVVLLEEKGAVFTTFIHDRAFVGDNVTLGRGSIICPGSIVTTNIRLGNHVHIDVNCSVDHDVVVEDFVRLSPACNLNGGVILESQVFLGTAALVIPGKRIGATALVGAGSVVIRDVPAGVTVFGNPAVVRTRATE